MPLTIDLLHEERALDKQRKRDPLKLGLLALVGVAFLFLAYYAYRLVGSTGIQHELRDRQAKWAVAEPKSRAAIDEEKDLSVKLAEGSAVSHRIESRFYWAPVLATLLRTTAPNIQVVDFVGSTEGSSGKVGITIEGIAADPEPRGAAEVFRRALHDALAKSYQDVAATFRNLEETKTSVLLDGRQMPAARFSIEISLSRPDIAAATVVPTEERRAKHS